MNSKKRSLVSIVSSTAALAATIGCLFVAVGVPALARNPAVSATNAIPTITIYFYSDGIALNVTASVVYQNPYVLDLQNNVIGDVQGNGTITDPNTDAVIGYITS